MLQVGCGLSPCALSAVTRQPAAAKPKTILFMLSSRCRDAALVGPVFGLAGVPSAEPDIAPSVQRRHSRSKQIEAACRKHTQEGPSRPMADQPELPLPFVGEGWGGGSRRSTSAAPDAFLTHQRWRPAEGRDYVAHEISVVSPRRADLKHSVSTQAAKRAAPVRGRTSDALPEHDGRLGAQNGAVGGGAD